MSNSANTGSAVLPKKLTNISDLQSKLDSICWSAQLAETSRLWTQEEVQQDQHPWNEL